MLIVSVAPPDQPTLSSKGKWIMGSEYEIKIDGRINSMRNVAIMPERSYSVKSSACLERF